MPVYCFVGGCHSTRYISKLRPKNEELVTFFKFPTEPELRKKWIATICTLNKQDINDVTKTASICEKHFARNCIRKNGLSLRLAPSAIPSIFPNMIEQSNSPETIDLDIMDVNAVDSRLNDENLQDIYLRENTIETKVQNTVKFTNKSTSKFSRLTQKCLLQYIATLKTTVKRQNTVIRRLRVRGNMQRRKIDCLKALLDSLITLQ